MASLQRLPAALPAISATPWDCQLRNHAPRSTTALRVLQWRRFALPLLIARRCLRCRPRARLASTARTPTCRFSARPEPSAFRALSLRPHARLQEVIARLDRRQRVFAQVDSTARIRLPRFSAQADRIAHRGLQHQSTATADTIAQPALSTSTFRLAL